MTYSTANKLAVIFDYNGTMVFDYEINKQAWLKLAEKLGKLETFNYEQLNGLNNLKTLEVMTGSQDKEYLTKLSEEKEVIYRNIARKSSSYKLVPGLEDLLDNLKENKIPFKIATASIKANVDFYYSYLRLDRWFEREDIVYDTGEYPSKAAMIKEAAKREKVSLNDLVIFDDSLVALRSIKKLGVKKIYALNPKGIDIEKEKLADRVIRDYTGITLAEL